MAKSFLGATVEALRARLANLPSVGRGHDFATLRSILIDALDALDAERQRAEALQAELRVTRGMLWNTCADREDAWAKLRPCDERIAAAEQRAAEAERKFADATKFCNGEWPCEASTSAASFEFHMLNAEAERDALQAQVRELREAAQAYLRGHSLECERHRVVGDPTGSV